MQIAIAWQFGNRPYLLRPYEWPDVARNAVARLSHRNRPRIARMPIKTASLLVLLRVLDVLTEDSCAWNRVFIFSLRVTPHGNKARQVSVINLVNSSRLNAPSVRLIVQAQPLCHFFVNFMGMNLRGGSGVCGEARGGLGRFVK